MSHPLFAAAQPAATLRLHLHEEAVVGRQVEVVLPQRGARLRPPAAAAVAVSVAAAIASAQPAVAALPVAAAAVTAAAAAVTTAAAALPVAAAAAEPSAAVTPVRRLEPRVLPGSDVQTEDRQL